MLGFECFLSSWVTLFCCLFLSFFWIPRTNFGRGKWCRFSLLVPWRSGRWLSFRADFWGTPSKVRAVFCERIVGLSGGFVVCFCWALFLLKRFWDCGVVSPFLHLGQVEPSHLWDSGIVALFSLPAPAYFVAFFRPLAVCSGWWLFNLRRSLWRVSVCFWLVRLPVV